MLDIPHVYIATFVRTVKIGGVKKTLEHSIYYIDIALYNIFCELYIVIYFINEKQKKKNIDLDNAYLKKKSNLKL